MSRQQNTLKKSGDDLPTRHLPDFHQIYGLGMLPMKKSKEPANIQTAMIKLNEREQVNWDDLRSCLKGVGCGAIAATVGVWTMDLLLGLAIGWLVTLLVATADYWFRH